MSKRKSRGRGRARQTKMREIVFIGRSFYSQSQSMMSPIYEKLENGSYQRFDYGYLETGLEEGETFHIRQATAEELGYFTKVLHDMNRRQEK